MFRRRHRTIRVDGERWDVYRDARDIPRLPGRLRVVHLGATRNGDGIRAILERLDHTENLRSAAGVLSQFMVRRHGSRLAAEPGSSIAYAVRESPRVTHELTGYDRES